MRDIDRCALAPQGLLDHGVRLTVLDLTVFRRALLIAIPAIVYTTHDAIVTDPDDATLRINQDAANLGAGVFGCGGDVIGYCQETGVPEGPTLGYGAVIHTKCPCGVRVMVGL